MNIRHHLKILLVLLPVLLLSNVVTGASVGTESAVEEFGPSHLSPYTEDRAASSLPEAPDVSLLLSGADSSSTASGGWQAYPIYGGEMTSMAMDPANPQTVYVGTRAAGVFKTTDGGQSWWPARYGLTFFPIRSLQVDPQHPSVLYAGTDFDGIWKSTDGGNSWFDVSSGIDESLIVFNIVIDPQDTDVLYAGLAGGLGLLEGQIYKSENGGATWAKKDSGIPRYYESYAHGIFSLSIDVSTASVYAGTRCGGVFKSVNGGELWTAVNDGLPFDYPECRETINAIAVDPHHPGQLGAIVGGEYYVFGGSQWQKISQGDYANGSMDPGYLYFHPTDPSIIYSTVTEFTKSLNGGVNWTQHLGWPDSSQVPEIAFHPSSPDTIYAVTDVLGEFSGGVYKTTDQGETWAKISQGITAVAIESVTIDPYDSDYIYAGEADGHFYRSQDGGVTWYRGFLGGSGISDIAVNPLDSQNIYATSGFVYKSTDRGETFDTIYDVVASTCIAIAPDVSSSIYVGTSFGVYKSSDGGLTWQEKNQGMSFCTFSACHINDVVIDPNDPLTIWVGTAGDGIAKSVDGGENWQFMGLPDHGVGSITFHPEDSDTILVSTSFVTPSAIESRIYESTDGGNTWQTKCEGIGPVMVIDPRDPSLLYGADDYEVVQSWDGGMTWLGFSEGIFYPLVYTVAITQDDPPLLIAGSYGSGLYWIYPSIPTKAYLPLVVKSD
ncbi:MAG: hypothetical protein JXA14_08775 [Anaerolineae bacterium]|nr:hypothetical protein [Anaerolineae bacterium]